MQPYSLRQMRKEYRGVLKACIGGVVMLLLLGAIFGAVTLAQHNRAGWIFLGLMLAGVMACLGCYLIFSDEKWLLKKTPFGQCLAELGDARDVMRSIDESARKQCDSFGNMTLLADWLMLEYPLWWHWEPYRFCVVPIRRDGIQAARLLQEKNPDDPEERHIQIAADDQTYDLYLYSAQTLDALRAWLRDKELETL